MIHVWTTQSSALLLHFFALPFLVITLALGEQISHAESAIGPDLSHQSLLIPSLLTDLCPSVVTIPVIYAGNFHSSPSMGSWLDVIPEETGYILAIV